MICEKNNLVKPNSAVQNLAGYCTAQLIPLLMQTANSVGARRIDVAWNLYSKSSIKALTRDRRGAGVRQQDAPNKGIVPKKWDDYLKNSENKVELFYFLATRFLQSILEHHVVTNVGNTIMSSINGISSTRPNQIDCSQMEEADGRMVFHVKDMAEHGAKSVFVRCSDTDVIVLAISYYHTIKDLGLEELWFLFGSETYKRYAPVHSIATCLGDNKAMALRGFHAFTGSDSTSFFTSKGKRTAWAAWREPEATVVFKCLAEPPSAPGLRDTSVQALERFTVLLDNANSDISNVNDARRSLFASGDKPITPLPPTSAALREHIKRVKYQAGEIWGRALEPVITTGPLADQWGWCKNDNGDGTLSPYWSALPPIWTASRTLDRCGCRSECGSMRCSCRRYTLPYTPACKTCQGECSNKSDKQK